MSANEQPSDEGPTYTAVDIANADKFAEYNMRIRMLSKMHDRAPHLMSWLNVTWRPATDDDFYVPESLADSCRVLKVEYTKSFCDMINCQSMKQQGPCTPGEAPSWYRVGDDSWDVQCQAACFNTSRKATYDSNGKRVADVPWVNYHNGLCRLVPPTASAMEKTFYRSEARFETRVNDMPTGFSRIKNNEPHSCGFTYRNNPTYCSYFDLHWVAATEDCKQTGLEYVVDAVIGMSFINTIRSSIRVFLGSGKPFPEPTGLPGPPAPVPPDKYRVDGWRKNINTGFTLPDVVDPVPKSGGSARSRRSLDRQPSVDMSSRVSRDPALAARNAERRAAERLARHTQSGRRKREADDETDATFPRAPDQLTLEEVVKRIVTGIYNAVQDPNTLVAIGLNYATDKALSILKKSMLKVASRMSSYLARGALQFGSELGVKVVVGSVRSLSLRVVTSFALRVGAKAVLALAKLLAAASSVIGWVLVVIGLFDLAFGIWDPFNYGKMLPPEWPRDAMKANEQALTQQFGASDPSYGVDELAKQLLTDEEFWELQIASMFDRAAYLNALVVNSEGSVIDKGQLVNTGSLPNDMFERFGNEADAQQYRFDPVTYRQDGERFHARTKLNGLLRTVTAIAFGVGAVAMFARFHLFALLAVVVAVICLCLSLASLQYDLLLDPYQRTFASFGQDAAATT